MALTAKVEWWKEGLSPEDTVQAWATAATTSVILAVLLEQRLAEGTDETKGQASKEDSGEK
jgi:hypothetical protein